MEDTHTDNLYTFLTVSFIVVSIIFAGGFYVYQRSLGMVAGEKVARVPVQSPTLIPTVSILKAAPTLSPSSARTGDAPVLKFALPHDCTGYVTDTHGNKTGFINGQVTNTIPQSEYVPDDIAKTVNWVVIQEPSGLPYTLTVVGKPEKAVAVYGLNEAGYEELELIDIPTGSGLTHTYTLKLDKQAMSDTLSVKPL